MSVADASYAGPQCPHCSIPLTGEILRSGTIACPNCRRSFEATVFTPPQQRIAAVEVVAAIPGGANACANHARNAAVTSCQRCGLFICSLCDMNVGAGSFCPSCFERMRMDGSMAIDAKKYRDYAATARISVIAGVLLSLCTIGLGGVPFGAIALYSAIKGVRQRREEKRSIAGVVALAILGAVLVVGGLGVSGYLIWNLFNTK